MTQNQQVGAAQRRPVIDIYARLSYAVNGETIKVDDQVEVCEEVLERRGAVAGERFKDNSFGVEAGGGAAEVGGVDAPVGGGWVRRGDRV